MDVFFRADDRQEYLDLISRSAWQPAIDFLACCLMSNHACLVVVRRQNHLSRKRSCSVTLQIPMVDTNVHGHRCSCYG